MAAAAEIGRGLWHLPRSRRMRPSGSEPTRKQRRLLKAAAALLAASIAVLVLASGSPAAQPIMKVLGFSGTDGRLPSFLPSLVPPGGTDASCYPSELKAIFVFATYKGFAKGTPVELRWFHRGTHIGNAKLTLGYRAGWFSSNLDMPSVNSAYDGKYTVEITYAGRVIASGSVTRETTTC